MKAERTRTDYEIEFIKMAKKASLSYAVLSRYAPIVEAACRGFPGMNPKTYFFMFLIGLGNRTINKVDAEIAMQGRTLVFGKKEYNYEKVSNIRAVIQELAKKELIESEDVKELTLTEPGIRLLYEITKLFIDQMTEKLVQDGKLDEWIAFLEKHPDVATFEEKEKIVLSLKDLPAYLFEQILVDGEKTYLNIIELVTKALINRGLLQKRASQRHLNALKTSPIFFKYEPEIVKEQLTEFSKYYGDGLSVVSGWITSFTNVKNLDFGIMYSCENGHYRMSFKRYGNPLYCAHCNAELHPVFDVNIKAHQIVIEQADGSYIKAYIHADLWGPGNSMATKQKFMLIQLKQTAPKVKSVTEDLYLVLGLDQDEDVDISPKAAEKMACLSTEKILNLIRNTLYSRFVGTKKIEDAVILSMSTIGTDKIHIKSPRFKNEKINGTVNTLLWGLEGTGKSKVAKILNELISVRRGASTGYAGSTSIKGLTACYDKDLNAVKAGTIPLNDTYSVLIEELDKFNKEDMRELLEPFEEKKITYAKAGKQNIYRANTVNICTANPKKKPEDTSFGVIEQIKSEISRPLIDRIDIIVIVKGGVKSSAILAEWLKDSSREYLDPREIKNYFLCLREIKDVFLNREGIKYMLTAVEKFSVNITPRRLNSLIKLASGIAKLHLRDTICKTDIDEAYSYFLGFLESMGEITEDLIERMESADEITIMAENAKELFATQRERKTEEVAMIYNISESKAGEILQKMAKNGEIFSIDGDKWVRAG